MLHGNETRVWGDQAYRGQRAMIRQHAPKARDRERPIRSAICCCVRPSALSRMISDRQRSRTDTVLARTRRRNSAASSGRNSILGRAMIASPTGSPKHNQTGPREIDRPPTSRRGSANPLQRLLILGWQFGRSGIELHVPDSLGPRPLGRIAERLRRPLPTLPGILRRRGGLRILFDDSPHVSVYTGCKRHAPAYPSFFVRHRSSSP